MLATASQAMRYRSLKGNDGAPVPRGPASPADPTGSILPDFERECMELFAEVAQILSIPRSLGLIYGLLFASPQPLSFTDIVERLDISKGSASQGLQLLRAFGAVRSARHDDGTGAIGLEGEKRRPRWTKGGRREQFMPELGLRRLIGGLLREKIEPVLSGGDIRMRRLRECAKQAAEEPGAKFSLQRVKQLEKWRREMRMLLPLLRTILGSV
jgi:DNA-binding transcriptional regulator GbsR (MarR family)